MVKPILNHITQRIQQRSQQSRQAYLQKCQQQHQQTPQRSNLSPSNLAHSFAAAGQDKKLLQVFQSANIGIISAYNDMLSAHQPLQDYPQQIKDAVREYGCTAQFAGGVPAMCDGITQGTDSMELSLYSRDMIAIATAISLSHNVFDAGICLGICDKIVPGLLIGALSFGHLPFIFIPSGPMQSGLSNTAKTQARQQYANGQISRSELLTAESQSYHSAGTCTFYGTANSNQMLLEFMGLHLPGAAFVNPDTPLRHALTCYAAQQITRLTALGNQYTPLCAIVDEHCIVNALVGLLATGGSSNHTIHWIAVARAAGIVINWDDLNELSTITPLLCNIYPNGNADINHFHAAGGIAFVMRELLQAGLLHPQVNTVVGQGLQAYTQEPYLHNTQLNWRNSISNSADEQIIRPTNNAFSAEGGLRLLSGNLGRAIIKISAVADQHKIIQAPAKIFEDQTALFTAFKQDKLNQDFIAVIRFQGPSANGMPELHKLTPYLGLLQDRGYQVALLTDGRMSGASGKVAAAIHLNPEAKHGGLIAKIHDGDSILLDAINGKLQLLVEERELNQRIPAKQHQTKPQGSGRELFSFMRSQISNAEQGASIFNNDE